MAVNNKIWFLTLTIVLLKIAYASEQPRDCLTTTSTLDNLIKCLQKFIVRKNQLFPTGSWTPPSPTNSQRRAFSKLINDILSADGNCSEVIVPNELSRIYSVVRFAEKQSRFCVLYETQTVDGHFAYGWGIFVVSSSTNRSSSSSSPGQGQRMVHISVAHPFTDGQVQLQGANLFYKSKSKSLIISGLDRDVVTESSACQSSYYRYDGAHDNTTMFHTANLAVMNWQLNQPEKCPRAKCAFLQLHGKAKTSCTKTSIFLSAGLGRSPASLKFYENNTLPVHRLKDRLEVLFQSTNITVGSPLDDRSCSLTGTTNVFGRILNGVPLGKECRTAVDVNKATGYFIHAEQSAEARGKRAYDNWAKAIFDTFG